MIDPRATRYDGMPINPDMGEGRYQDALRRFRDRIRAGLELFEDDSNEMGNKHTHCSWGLCDDSVEAYPDPNDHIFPTDFPQRLGARNVSDDGMRCPMDRDDRPQDRKNGLTGCWGCFYRCRVFRPKPRGAAKPTREEALKLYDDLIAERVAKHGKRVTADDGEDAWHTARLKENLKP